MSRIYIFHPLHRMSGGFFGLQNSPACDVKEYGFRFDLTTQISYCSYDYGYEFVFRVLGFGIGVNWC
jgi:hypothetical protein